MVMRMRMVGAGQLPETSSRIITKCTRTSSSASSRKMDLSLFIYTLCLLLTLSCAQGPSWIREPEDTSRRLGETATIYCEVQNIGTRSVVWQRYVNNEAEPLFIDNKRINAPLTYNISGKYNLVIRDLKASDDGDFQCIVRELRKKVKLTVQVPPQFPQISLNKTTGLKEGDTLQLTCSSTGGNPPPNMTWWRNGQRIPDGEIKAPSTKLGTSSHVITWDLRREDHRANFSCRIEHVALATPFVTTQKLEVQYAPRISFGKYNPLSVLENSRVSLQCLTDANPPPVLYVWWRNNVELSVNNPSVDYTSVKKDQGGTHECQATNAVGTTKESMVLNVLYPPKVSSPKAVYEVNETKRLFANCTVDANPIARSPIWRKEGTSTTYRNPLDITYASRDFAGKWICSAENDMTPSEGPTKPGMGSYAVNVVVRYKPGGAIIDPVSSVLKGQSITLKCSAKDMGVPAAQFEWRKEGDSTVRFRGATYTLYNTALDDNGIYTCTPVNMIGSGTSNKIKVDINEQPEWLLPTLSPARTVNITNSGLTAMCKVRGRPQPTVKWFKDGIEITSSSAYFRIIPIVTPIDGHSNNVTSILQWTGQGRKRDSKTTEYSLRKEDTGVYSCRVTSTVSQPISLDHKLSVNFPPEIETDNKKVAVDINQTAVLSCIAYSLPVPQFTWYKGSAPITSSDRVTISTRLDMPPYVSKLNISDVRMSDLGNYHCLAKNNLGMGNVTINLTVKTVPDPPKNLQVSETTWESAKLSWDPGFSGGYAQVFVVQFYSKKHSERRILPEYVYNTYNLTGLRPSINYSIAMFAQNELGGSTYSNNYTVATNYLELPVPSDVTYNPGKRTVTFKALDANYCVRVEVQNAKENSWSVYADCATPKSSSIKINDDRVVDDVRVSMCLLKRKEVCGEPLKGKIVSLAKADVPVETIIIVACVCAAIVLVLVIILLCLCCKRRVQRKNYESEPANRRPQPVTTMNPSHALRGVDNPGMERVDMVDLEDPTSGGVFATDTSLLTNGMNGHNNYAPLASQKQKANGHLGNGHLSSNGHLGNGHLMNGNPGHPSAPNNYYSSHLHPNMPPPPNYDYNHQYTEENLQNKKNLDSSDEYPPSYQSNNSIQKKPSDTSSYMSHTLPDPYIFHHGRLKLDGNMSGNESGYSTPDPTKPKKVIHEVIV